MARVLLRLVTLIVIMFSFLVIAIQPVKASDFGWHLSKFWPAGVEPDRTRCGVLSLVVPKGTYTSIDTEPNGGFMKGHIMLAEGAVLELFYSGGQEMYPGFAKDASLRGQTERWRDSMADSMVKGQSAPIVQLRSPRMTGYYCLVEHDPESQPPNEYVRHTWPNRRFSLRGFFSLDGNVVAMGGVFDSEPEKTTTMLVNIMKTARWAGS